jgi:hypothetical protein
LTGATRKIVVFVGLGVLVAAVLAWQIARIMWPRPYRLQAARITKLDLATRSGEIEFVHPKSGHTTTVAATIPAECTIWFDGTRADLADLRVGDTVAVRGVYYPASESARPLEIWATRQPATVPADQAP